MSVDSKGDVIRLSGRCPAEEAEALLAALHDRPGRTVDLGGVERMHMAVAQVLLAARPRVRGVPETPFLAGHLLKLLQ